MLLRQWQQVKDGEGHIVLLSGEPGIGKSRLVRGTRAARPMSPTYACSTCSPHHTNSPLHPLIEQLERAAGFARDEPPRRGWTSWRRCWHAARTARRGGAADRGAARHADGGPLSGARSDPAAPEAADAARRWSSNSTGSRRERPVLLAYEDMHWSDPTTQELLGLTIERLQRLPVLAADHLPAGVQPAVACSAARQRAGAEPARPARGRRDGRAGGRDKALPDEVVAQIVAKTDGVPLFVEELTKTVLKSGLLTDAGDHYELAGPLPPLAMPSTLHDSLLARLDRLAPVKEVAQIGAAIGREFSHGLLAAVAAGPRRSCRRARPAGRGRAGLSPRHAARRHLQLQARAGPGRRLRVRCSKSRRQQLHARIAQVMEDQFPEIVETQPELLAQHYTGAGLTEQAIVYWDKAGERAIQASANAEAIERLSKALELLETVPETPERIRRELAFLTRLGLAVIAVKGFASLEVGDRLHPGARAVRPGRGLPTSCCSRRCAAFTSSTILERGTTRRTTCRPTARSGTARTKPLARVGSPQIARVYPILSRRVRRGPNAA